MELIYITTNMRNVLTHISSIMDGDYDNQTEIDESSFIHPNVIFRISKKKIHLIEDMKNAILFKSGATTIASEMKSAIEMVETIKAYYISMSLQDVISFKNAEFQDNQFIYKIGKLYVSHIQKENNLERFDRAYKKDRVKYSIGHHPKYDFYTLNDLRYLFKDYIYLYDKYDDLSRDDLNRLYRLTIWIKCPIYVSRDISHDFRISSHGTSRVYGDSITYEGIDDIHNLSFKLSQLTTLTEFDASKINFNIKARDILSFLSTVDKGIRDNPNVPDSLRESINHLTPLAAFTDVFLTVSFDQLYNILNADDSLVGKSYREYIQGVIESLLHNNYGMEFILKDRRELI